MPPSVRKGWRAELAERPTKGRGAYEGGDESERPVRWGLPWSARGQRAPRNGVPT